MRLDIQRCVLAGLLSFAATTTAAQQEPGLLPGNDLAPLYMTHSALISEWRPVLRSSSTKQIVAFLAGEGLRTDVVASTLDDTISYRLYAKTLISGQDTFLAVPDSANTKAIQFNAWQTRTLNYIEAVNIKEAIADAIQSSIDAICSIDSKPSQIRVQASALEIVEIEVTWDSAEACN